MKVVPFQFPPGMIGIHERIVPVAPLIARIPWRFPILDPSKESIIGFLDPQDHILQDMTSRLLIFWSDLLLDRDQIPFLLIVANGLASHLVGFFAFLQRGIVEFSASI